MNDSDLVTVDLENPDPVTVEQAGERLRRGQLLVVPTETRYGLLMRADQRELVERLYHLKKKKISSPTAMFLRDYGQISTYGETNRLSDTLAGSFLPGPITLVVKAIVDLGEPIVVDGKIGVRVSSSPLIDLLLQRIDFPVTATSANISGGQEFDTVREIAAVLGDDVDLYLDAGPLSGPASTVVDCSNGEAKVLRYGAISREMIEKALEKMR